MRLLNSFFLCFLSAAAAMCQAVPYRISTLAGSGAVVFTGEGGAATGARLVDPDSAARDAAGGYLHHRQLPEPGAAGEPERRDYPLCGDGGGGVCR